MAIIIHKDQRLFTMHTRNSTYQIKADQWGYFLEVFFVGIYFTESRR